MDKLTNLTSQLRRLGHRAQKAGDKIGLEFDAHSRMLGSVEQIEKFLPKLKRENNLARGRKQPRSKIKKTRRTGKMVITSANIRAKSVECDDHVSPQFSRSQGGLPGLGKRH